MVMIMLIFQLPLVTLKNSNLYLKYAIGLVIHKEAQKIQNMIQKMKQKFLKDDDDE